MNTVIFLHATSFCLFVQHLHSSIREPFVQRNVQRHVFSRPLQGWSYCCYCAGREMEPREKGQMQVTGVGLQRNRISIVASLQLRITKSGDVYFQYCPSTERRLVPWPCHQSTCNTSSFLRSAILFAHSLVLWDCICVVLSLALLCYYLLFSCIASWKLGN